LKKKFEKKILIIKLGIIYKLLEGREEGEGGSSKKKVRKKVRKKCCNYSIGHHLPQAKTMILKIFQCLRFFFKPTPLL
jgi:hypothetical protein